MLDERLEKQVQFILEIDKLKAILRRTYVTEEQRQENSAEHSWHVAMMAWLLAEHANEPIDVTRVTKMMMVHDIVEIDAGDTYCYDEQGSLDKAERELAAADRIFHLLPQDQGEELRALWDEFESRETPEARFAAALDRVMPLMHNYHTQGRSWQEHGIRKDQVLAHNRHTGEGSEALWELAKEIIEKAAEAGYLSE